MRFLREGGANSKKKNCRDLKLPQNIHNGNTRRDIIVEQFKYFSDQLQKNLKFFKFFFVKR